jgi:hypothetical protein
VLRLSLYVAFGQVLEHKLIYLETKDVVETTLALDNYKRACDSGRGAVFLSVARGKVAEGIDFDRHYGRCVVLFGIPYQYTLSHVLRARLNYMRERYGIRDNDFLTFDALRQAAQCVGRVIRSKTDYGVVVLADSRYNRTDKRSKFPPWILQFVKESCLNLPTDSAVDQIKSFLRYMGQPIDQEALHSILLNESQVSSMFQQHRAPPSVTLLEEEMRAAKAAAGEAGPGSSSSSHANMLVEEPDMVAAAGLGNRSSRASTQEYESADENAEEYGMGVDADGNPLGPAPTESDPANTVPGPVKGGPPGQIAQGRAGGAPSRRSVFLFEDILDASDGEE